MHGHSISTDCLYTSVPLAKWLLERNITTVGPVQKGPQRNPQQLFDVPGRQKFSVTYHHEKDYMDEKMIQHHILSTLNQRVKQTLLFYLHWDL